MPSSLTRVLSHALEYSSHPPVSVLVRSPSTIRVYFLEAGYWYGPDPPFESHTDPPHRENDYDSPYQEQEVDPPHWDD